MVPVYQNYIFSFNISVTTVDKPLVFFIFLNKWSRRVPARLPSRSCTKYVTKGKECDNRSNLTFALNFLFKYILSNSLFYLKNLQKHENLENFYSRIKEKFRFEKKFFALSFGDEKDEFLKLLNRSPKKLVLLFFFVVKWSITQEIFAQLLQKIS